MGNFNLFEQILTLIILYLLNIFDYSIMFPLRSQQFFILESISTAFFYSKICTETRSPSRLSLILFFPFLQFRISNFIIMYVVNFRERVIQGCTGQVDKFKTPLIKIKNKIVVHRLWENARNLTQVLLILHTFITQRYVIDLMEMET